MMLFFTNLGKVYWLKVFQIPLASRGARGRPMVNLLNLDEGERVTSMLPVEEYTEDQFIFFATANGTVKKTPLMAFSRQRSVGLIAIDLVEDDVLVSTAITDGSQDVMLLSSEGKSVRFRESDVRSMGRTAKGVRGIRLPEEHSVLSMIIPEENGYILTVSENGYGKRTAVTEYPCKGRGGKGVIAMTCSERNGSVVGAVQVKSGDEIMLISDQGTLIRTRTDEISQSGRNTQGVRVIRVKGDENLVSMARIDESQIQEELPPEEDAEGTVSEAPVSDSDVPAAEGDSSNESDTSSD
jgi:DNA gyrase subunit A